MGSLLSCDVNSIPTIAETRSSSGQASTGSNPTDIDRYSPNSVEDGIWFQGLDFDSSELAVESRWQGFHFSAPALNKCDLQSEPWHGLSSPIDLKLWPDQSQLHPDTCGELDGPDSGYHSSRSLSVASSLVSCTSALERFDRLDELDRSRCSDCKKEFPTVFALEQHAQKSGHLIFSCPLPGCEKAYCRRDSWTRHKKTHQAELVCPFCSQLGQRKHFTRRDHLRSHIRNAHPEHDFSSDTRTPALTAKEEPRSSRRDCDCSRRSKQPGVSTVKRERSADSLSYQSSAVRELMEEVRSLHGTTGIQALDEHLNVNHKTSTKQLAASIGSLVVGDMDAPRIKIAKVQSQST